MDQGLTETNLQNQLQQKMVTETAVKLKGRWLMLKISIMSSVLFNKRLSFKGGLSLKIKKIHIHLYFIATKYI